MRKQSVGYKILRYGLLLVVVLLPFHAFFTTWLGSNSGHLLAVRAWKEVVVTLLNGIGLYYFIVDKTLRLTLWSRTINKLIVAYGAWLLLVSTVHTPPLAALAQGLAIDFRFLTVFVLFQIVLYYQPVHRELLYKIVLIPSVGVVVFSLMQLVMLPRDFLTHFGYNKYKTIPPFFTIDQQLTNLRYASTLSGPNTLGAYLVLTVMLVVGNLKQLARKGSHLFVTSCYLFAAVIALYATHSRSAWLAAAISLAVFLYLRISEKMRLILIVAGLIGALLVGFGTYQYRHTQFVQDVILHDDPTEGGEVSSNLGHVDAIQSAASDVIARPLVGCGVGCAGPASVRTNQPKIAENYYLQVAQESGVVGLGLLLTIVIFVGKELYKKRGDSLALAVFSSLIGLSVCNLLLHTWADDTLAIIWWSVAAVALFNNQIRSGSFAASSMHQHTSS